MKKNIFLNKSIIAAWNPSKTAFMIQSPKTKNAGIWIPYKWYQQSKKYNNYFALGIVTDHDYEEWFYQSFKKQKIGIIKGSELFELLQLQKNINSIKHLQELQKTEKALSNNNIITSITKEKPKIKKELLVMSQDDIDNFLKEIDAQ